MHARHVTIRIRPDCVAQAREIFTGGALPALAAQPGFRGACLLADDATGGDGAVHGVILILWESAAHSRRLEAAGFYREQIARFAQVFAAPPEPALLRVEAWAIHGR
jgi:heme-degrading monooxygenase HmoA